MILFHLLVLYTYGICLVIAGVCLFIQVIYLLIHPYQKKVWEWYGKTWAIYDPYLGMVWEGWVKIWNKYGARFCHILMYGKYMGRNADDIHCMGKLWEHNFHIYPIAATYLLALRLLWEWYGMSTVQYFISSDIIFFKSHRLPIWIFYKFNLWVYKSSTVHNIPNVPTKRYFFRKKWLKNKDFIYVVCFF